VENGVPTGTPVTLAARIAECAADGEVLVSRTVRDIVGDAGLPFEDRGVRHIDDAGEWRLFSA
jgi:class 3 adenylate cyclase